MSIIPHKPDMLYRKGLISLIIPCYPPVSAWASVLSLAEQELMRVRACQFFDPRRLIRKAICPLVRDFLKYVNGVPIRAYPYRPNIQHVHKRLQLTFVVAELAVSFSQKHRPVTAPHQLIDQLVHFRRTSRQEAIERASLIEAKNAC